MPVQPHVLILPSDLLHFFKDINGCLVTNPQRLVKGESGGVFSRYKNQLKIEYLKSVNSHFRTLVCSVLKWQKWPFCFCSHLKTENSGALTACKRLWHARLSWDVKFKEPRPILLSLYYFPIVFSFPMFDKMAGNLFSFPMVQTLGKPIFG